ARPSSVTAPVMSITADWQFVLAGTTTVTLSTSNDFLMEEVQLTLLQAVPLLSGSATDQALLTAVSNPPATSASGDPLTTVTSWQTAVDSAFRQFESEATTLGALDRAADLTQYQQWVDDVFTLLTEQLGGQVIV